MTYLEYRLSAFVLRVWYALCSLRPVRKDKVVFASARAARLEGNLAWVHRALVARRPDLKPVLLLERYSWGLAGKIAYLFRLLRATAHIANARVVFVDNAYFPVHIGPHRSGTTVIQLWHAAGALKRFGLDVAPPERAVENLFVHRYYDYAIVGSEDARAAYASAFRMPLDRVIALGSPRTDFFFDEAALDEARTRVLRAMPALHDRRIVLYAPTFRGHGIGKCATEALDARALRDALPSEYALVYKAHPVLAECADSAGFDAVVGDDLDLNELFAATDVFVTDYSSSILEFALLKRPIVVFADDLAAYEQDPGFYFDFRSEIVGEVVDSTEGVAACIRRGSLDLKRYDAFIAKHCSAIDGHSTERVVDFALEFLG